MKITVLKWPDVFAEKEIDDLKGEDEAWTRASMLQLSTFQLMDDLPPSKTTKFVWLMLLNWSHSIFIISPSAWYHLCSITIKGEGENRRLIWCPCTEQYGIALLKAEAFKWNKLMVSSVSFPALRFFKSRGAYPFHVVCLSRQKLRLETFFLSASNHSLQYDHPVLYSCDLPRAGESYFGHP